MIWKMDIGRRGGLFRAWRTGLVLVPVVLFAVVPLFGVAPTAAQEPGCPTELGGLPLALESRDDAEPIQLICSYEPAQEGTASRLVLIVSYAPPGTEVPAPLCAGEDLETEEDTRWFGFDYSAATAASVWYNADDQSLGVDKDAVRQGAAAALAQVEPLAQPCPGAEQPPVTTTTAPPPTETTAPPPTETTIAEAPVEAPPFEVPADLCLGGSGLGQVIEVSGNLDAGWATVVCDNEPFESERFFLSPLRLEISYARPGDPAIPMCGLPPVRTESDGQVTGVLYGGTVAVEVTWVVLDAEAGYDETSIWAAAGQGYTAAAAQAVPCPATADGHDLANGLPPWAAQPPLGPYAPELEWYSEVVSCPQAVGGFELSEERDAWAIGRDWIGHPCEYTRSGVDPEQAAPEDRAELDVNWYKVNGRNASGCFPFESETDVFHETRSIESGFFLTDQSAAPAFREAAQGLVTQVEPVAYVCPNFNEIAFDPIPPYWQPVFGSPPPPPPLVLPDVVTAADVSSGAAYTSAAVEGGDVAPPPAPGPDVAEPGVEPPPEEAAVEGEAPPGAVQPTAPAPSRSGLWRVAGIAGLVLSILGLAVSILLVRKRSRVRPKWDNARLAISAVTIVVMTVVIGVDTPFLFIVIGLVVGAVVGLLQGRNLIVQLTERGLYAKRNIIAAVFFAVGLVIVQAAGLANRTGAVTLGLTVSFLSAAMTAGLIFGRRRRIADAHTAAVAAMIVVVGLALVGGVAGPQPISAQEDAADPARELLLDMVDWDQIRVLGGLWATTGKPLLTVSVPRGLDTAPEPITQTVAWEQVNDSGAAASYDISESYTFALRDDGGCCTVTYVADGTQTFANQEPQSVHAEAFIDNFRPEGSGGFTGITPFTDPEVFRKAGVAARSPEGRSTPPCGRVVAKVGFGGAEFTAYTTDGEPGSGGPVELFLLADCDVPEFTVSNALAVAPPPPPPQSDERFQGDLGPCPVLQEIARPISEAAGLDTGSVNTVGVLYLEPNRPVCDYIQGVGLGDFRPGGLQLTISWNLASDNPELEAARIDEINNDFIGARRQFNIYEEESCQLDAEGEILAPAEGEECFRSQFFAVGSEVFIFTEYVADGPNVTVRGRFPWGSYFFFCHHCDPGSAMVRNAIAAWHRAGSGGAPIAGTAEPGDGVTEEGEGAVTGEAGSELEDLAGLFVDEGDIDARDAAVAAIIALIGSAALAGTALVETGTNLDELADALRSGGEEEVPEAAEQVSVWDPRTETATWMTPDQADDFYKDLRDWERSERAEATTEAIRAAKAASAERDEVLLGEIRRDRGILEAHEEAQRQAKERLEKGARRIAGAEGEEFAGRVEELIAAGNYTALDELYRDAMEERLAVLRGQRDEALADARVMEIGERISSVTVTASKGAIMALSGPAGYVPTMLASGAISSAEQGAESYVRGDSALEVAARTGVGYLSGVKDGLVGRFTNLPSTGTATKVFTSAVTDAADVYAQARLNGMTHDQAVARAGHVAAVSAGGEVVGGLVDVLPNGIVKEVAQLGTGAMAAGTLTWLEGGDFYEGAGEGLINAVAGRAGAAAAGRVQQMASSPEAIVKKAIADRAAADTGEIPLEQQAEVVRQADASRRVDDASPQTKSRVVQDEDGTIRIEQTQEQWVGEAGVTVKDYADDQPVLEGYRDTAASRTAKNAPQATKDAIVNTRSDRINAPADAKTIAEVAPKLVEAGMLQPGDELVMDTFSTPGKPPSLGADRDARLVIRREVGPGEFQTIEVPRQHWERQAYVDWYDHTLGIQAASGQDIPADVLDQWDARMEHLDYLRGEGWTAKEIEARAWGEVHNQLFTDRHHMEASADNSDQLANWLARTGATGEGSPVRQVQEGNMPLLDAQGFSKMWEEKTAFYADFGNNPEALAQSRKGIEQYMAVREGYEAQNMAPPPLSHQDAQAMAVIVQAPTGVDATPEAMDRVLSQLRQIYGQPDLQLQDGLARVAMNNEVLPWSQPADQVPQIGLSTGQLNHIVTGEIPLPEDGQQL